MHVLADVGWSANDEDLDRRQLACQAFDRAGGRLELLRDTCISAYIHACIHTYIHTIHIYIYLHTFTHEHSRN